MNTNSTKPLGLYLHIPYCKQACSYCNFYFSTQLRSIDNLVDALCLEIEQRKHFWPKRNLKTIYFGGGTPSILSSTHLSKIFTAISNHFIIDNCIETTLECNPDDINIEKLNAWKANGINRLSIGIQSFNNEHLTLMNRSHNALEATNAITLANKSGFSNLTIDYIYGIPGQTDAQLLDNLSRLKEFDITHFSAYALTVEPKTLLENQIKKQLVKETDDETFERHFRLIKDFAHNNGFEHYEISNFSEPGKRAQHNSSYWNMEPYLGIGPAAHSFDLKNRYWNVANIHKYIKAINSGDTSYEMEKLSEADKYNEYLLTKLRTIEGVNINYIKKNHPDYMSLFLGECKRLLSEHLLNQNDNIFVLTNKGQFLCDHVTARLMTD